MCGVIGLICERTRQDLGQIAAELLKTLEYRGYDSTGAAVQGDQDEALTLVKGVGAPSVMVDSLGIKRLAGSIFCGQVRWATFGAVTDANSQPHQVRCKTHLYGAHNGNVTNCDDLQQWLRDEGHQVLSDNDGEMVVHTIEHYFAQELQRHGADRHRAMRLAILRACERLVGSYAAVVVDPVSRTLWAIKRGSSLYFGFGRDEQGAFGVASSDLSAVLKLTRVLVPLNEGELIEYRATARQVYAIDRPATPEADARALERAPVRSRLRAKDTALLPPFTTFMDQEIHAQVATGRAVITAMSGGSAAARVLAPYLATLGAADRAALDRQLQALLELYDDQAIRAAFEALCGAAPLRRLLDALPPAVAAEGSDAPPAVLADRLASSEAGFMADLLAMARGQREILAVRVLDTLIEVEEVAELDAAVTRFLDLALACLRRSGRIFVVCCGSSYHAARAAALFFNELAQVDLIPILPGDFRGQYSHAVRDGDGLVAVSQSGETKDLIDVLNALQAAGRRVARVALVNNLSSTLAQEKSDLVLPLRCGPEVAVPATKSFINQLAVFYCLALRLAERLLDEPALAQGTADELARRRALLAERRARLDELPRLIEQTLRATDAEVQHAARALYLAPSIHLLATRITAVALEGALKIREVVINHAEGYEASEFKHGPNTLLGLNTVLGPRQVGELLAAVGRCQERLLAEAATAGLDCAALARAVAESVLAPGGPLSLPPAERALAERHVDRQALLATLRRDYPLLYLTGPEERDVALTVSQINTHKIRGAATIVVAEEHPALRQAASKPPADNPRYSWAYIALPRTGDTLLTVFSATVVLQRLALAMSLLKQAYLDGLGLADHGVHPDVPKNVSKSITVD